MGTKPQSSLVFQITITAKLVAWIGRVVEQMPCDDPGKPMLSVAIAEISGKIAQIADTIDDVLRQQGNNLVISAGNAAVIKRKQGHDICLSDILSPALGPLAYAHGLAGALEQIVRDHRAVGQGALDIGVPQESIQAFKDLGGSTFGLQIPPILASLEGTKDRLDDALKALRQRLAEN